MKTLNIITLIGILLYLSSCKENNSDSNCADKSFSVTEEYSSPLPNEVIFEYNKPEECFESIINMYEIESPAKLLASYKMGIDIKPAYGHLQWFLISSVTDSGLKIHFISKAHGTSREIRIFSLLGEELVTVFSFIQYDKTIGYRNFIVAITKTGDEYFNAVFEQVCGGSVQNEEYHTFFCDIQKIDANFCLPVLRSYKEFKLVFPKIYKEFDSCTKKKNYSRDFEREDFLDPDKYYIAHFIGSGSDDAIISNISDYTFERIFSWEPVDKVYSIGKQISNPFYFLKKVFFRIDDLNVNKPYEICFVFPVQWIHYNDDKVNNILKFPISGKDSILSVFDYTDTASVFYNQDK